MTIDVKQIEIFSRIDASRHDTVVGLFSARECVRGNTIIRYGEPVDGLYVLDQGEVEVSIPGFQGVLARLPPGSIFGELSLFNADDTASASVTVSSEQAVIDFCPRAALVRALEDDEVLAAGFYHGSALLVASRLRTTNQKISGEIAKSIKMASSLIEEISTLGNLGTAQKEIKTAGSHIVSGMTVILKGLLVMKESHEPIPPAEIARLADRAKEIYYTDFQVFEKVHSQLTVLGQHLDNVTRLLSQQELLEVEEDFALQDL